MKETRCPKCRHKFVTVSTQPAAFDHHRTVLPDRDPNFDPATALSEARQALAKVPDA